MEEMTKEELITAIKNTEDFIRSDIKTQSALTVDGTENLVDAERKGQIWEAKRILSRLRIETRQEERLIDMLRNAGTEPRRP